MKNLSKQDLQKMQELLTKISNQCGEFTKLYNNNVDDGAFKNCNFDVLYRKIKETADLCDEAHDVLYYAIIEMQP